MYNMPNTIGNELETFLDEPPPWGFDHYKKPFKAWNPYQLYCRYGGSHAPRVDLFGITPPIFPNNDTAYTFDDAVSPEWVFTRNTVQGTPPAEVPLDRIYIDSPDSFTWNRHPINWCLDKYGELQSCPYNNKNRPIVLEIIAHRKDGGDDEGHCITLWNITKEINPEGNIEGEVTVSDSDDYLLSKAGGAPYYQTSPGVRVLEYEYKSTSNRHFIIKKYYAEQMLYTYYENVHVVYAMCRNSPSLMANVHHIPVDTGGSVEFTLDAGWINGSKGGVTYRYCILGSDTNKHNGFVPSGSTITVPINFDWLTQYILENLNGNMFTNFDGNLNFKGEATATLNLLSVPQSYSGYRMYFAFVVLNKNSGKYTFASNPVCIEYQ
jgi:hypothetical protein